MGGLLKITRERLIPLTLALFLLPGCDLFGEPVAKGSAIDGKVLETSTDKPISGAIVVASWSGMVGSLAHSQGVCFHVESTTSDAQGRYHIPAWEKQTRFARAKHQVVAIIAFNPGYRFAQERAGNTLYLERFTGTREERLKYLVNLFGATGCGAQDESEKNRIPLLKNLHKEAQGLAQTKEEQRLVESIQYALEILELGLEEAEKRHLQRP